MCVFCRRHFTAQDEQAGQVQMLLTDNCYHQFHIECLRKEATSRMYQKNPNGDFKQVFCHKCGLFVNNHELINTLGKDFMENIWSTQVTMHLQNGLTECPSCKSKFYFEEDKPNYLARDENGQQVSKETAEHMAVCRVRCSDCKNNFCVKCKITPYHLGTTCEKAKQFRAATKCRFCWEEMKEPSVSQDEAFRDVCRKPPCIEMM